MHDRKPGYLGLGSAASVSLATARSLASDARRQLDLGQDAKRLAEREAAADKARSMTFEECAEPWSGIYRGWLDVHFAFTEEYRLSIPSRCGQRLI